MAVAEFFTDERLCELGRSAHIIAQVAVARTNVVCCYMYLTKGRRIKTDQSEVHRRAVLCKAVWRQELPDHPFHLQPKATPELARNVPAESQLNAGKQMPRM